MRAPAWDTAQAVVLGLLQVWVQVSVLGLVLFWVLDSALGATPNSVEVGRLWQQTLPPVAFRPAVRRVDPLQKKPTPTPK